MRKRVIIVAVSGMNFQAMCLQAARAS